MSHLYNNVPVQKVELVGRSAHNVRLSVHWFHSLVRRPWSLMLLLLLWLVRIGMGEGWSQVSIALVGRRLWSAHRFRGGGLSTRWRHYGETSGHLPPQACTITIACLTWQNKHFKSVWGSVRLRRPAFLLLSGLQQIPMSYEHTGQRPYQCQYTAKASNPSSKLINCSTHGQGTRLAAS